MLYITGSHLGKKHNPTMANSEFEIYWYAGDQPQMYIR